MSNWRTFDGRQYFTAEKRSANFIQRRLVKVMKNDVMTLITVVLWIMMTCAPNNIQLGKQVIAWRSAMELQRLEQERARITNSEHH